MRLSTAIAGGRRGASVAALGKARAKPGSIEARTELDVILVEYQTLREDERATTNAQTALVSVFVALLAGLFAILVGDCRFHTAKGGACYELYESVYVVAPLLPLAVLTYIVMLGVQVSIRSLYMRAVENEIRKHARSPLDSIPEITAASSVELLLTVTSPRRGHLGYRMMLIFLTVSSIIAMGGWVTFAALSLSPAIKIILAAVYGPLLSLIIYGGLMANVRSRSVLRRATAQLERSPHYPDLGLLAPSVPSAQSGRSLVRYLLLPRPVDVTKWLFVPIAALIAFLHVDVDPVDRVPLLWAAGTWLVFEYLIYQGRYQWNDIRGFGDDIAHPAAVERGRLPSSRFGPRFSVSASLLVILAKAALATIFALLAPGAVADLIWMSFLAVWSLALGYEWLRGNPDRMHHLAPAIWSSVGMGYAIRTALGLLLFGLNPHGDTLWPFVSFVVAAWLFGIVFVTLTWVLEAIGHCRGQLPGVLVYPDDSLSRKPHLIPLLRYAGVDVRRLDPSDPVPPSAEGEEFLKGWIPLVSPWNVAVVAATSVSAAAAIPASLRSWPLITAALTITAVATAGITMTTSSRARWVASTATTVAVAILGLLLFGSPQGFVPPVTAMIFLLMYTAFRDQSYKKLKNFLPDIRKFLDNMVADMRALCSRAFRAFVGTKTSDLIKSPSQIGPP